MTGVTPTLPDAAAAREAEAPRQYGGAGPGHRAPARDRWQPLVFWTAIAAVLAASLWLRGAFPIHAIGVAVHDDALFVRLAASIGEGRWLGEYDNLTHAKGAAYSIFLAASRGIGLPLKLSEHLLYLLSALALSLVAGRILRSRWACLCTFALLAFIPTAWNPDVGGRVVREGLYVSLSLLLLALAAHGFLPTGSRARGEPSRGRWFSLASLGLVAGVYWLTREEGAWLVPALAIIVAYGLWWQVRARRPWREVARMLALPALPAALVIGAVNAVNYAHYGVFRNNDFRSTDFQAAYGALSRIRHDQWQRYVVFPADARARAYRFSAAARELQPYFEGPAAGHWREIGCTHAGLSPCPEILSSVFMWALRDAAAAAGHYRSAREARAFFRRLAAEIDLACERYPDECLGPRRTLVPPWHRQYAAATARASGQVFRTLTRLGDVPIGEAASIGNCDELRPFVAVTRGPISPSQRCPAPVRAALEPNGIGGPAAGGGALSIERGSWLARLWSPAGARDVRIDAARTLAGIEGVVARIAFPAAALAVAGWLLVAGWRRSTSVELVFALALAAAVAARIVLLGFLDATSIPSNNLLYLLPAAPFALALVPVVLFGVLAAARRSHRAPSDPTLQSG